MENLKLEKLGGDCDEEPPGTNTASVPVDIDGDNRHHFNIFYFATFFLCRNSLQSRWILLKVLGSNVTPNNV